MTARPGDQPRHTSGATMADREWIAEDDHLNREALRALRNWRVDRERALADLLASDVPIHWFVRKALAAALAGKPIFQGSELSFKGTNQSRKNAMAYETRKERLLIADWVKAAQRQYGSYELAVEAAASDQFHCSVNKVKDAITYSNHIDACIATMQVPGTEYGSWSREDLRDRYIGFDATGEMMPPNRTLQQIAADAANEAELLAQLFSSEGGDS